MTEPAARSGRSRPRRGRIAFALALAGMLVAEALPFAAFASAEVPVPRPNPSRQGGGGRADTIANLIGTAGALIADPAGQGGRAASFLNQVQSGDFNLKAALKMLDAGDLDGATAAARGVPGTVGAHLIEYLVATGGSPGVSSARIAGAMRELQGWPGQNLMRIRFEQALIREKPSAEQAIAALSGSRPITDGAVILLARSLVASGRTNDAAALLRPFWRTEPLSAEDEKTVVKEFGSLLTAADTRWRMDQFLYDGDNDEAARVAKLLDAGTRAIADAWIAVNKRSGKAASLISAVPSRLNSDPGLLFARIQYLRRAGKYAEAANLLMGAPRDANVLVDPEAWSQERRLIAWELADAGDARTAYRLVSEHSARVSTEVVEVEFQAGFYALRYLNDPRSASRHFRAIEEASTMPLSQSRAEYWLGRAAEAAGDNGSAVAHYRRAANYPTTFYGQLSIVRLNSDRLALSAPPRPNDSTRAHFRANELVQAIEALTAAGRTAGIDVFYRYLADTLTDPAEMALLAEMAESRGMHQLALQIGKTAQTRGMPVETLAFPTAAIPPLHRQPAIEMPVVYAIARQESAFNPAAISSAGARGLLQLMPATAKQVCRVVGLPYSRDRLTSDPAYNATLGAVHLADLYQQFGGSYVMTFAAYNAGASRVRQWVAERGDPRDPSIDIVDWIERIPFSETRNYVQRTLENLQVYRARLGEPTLRIQADLGRAARS